MKSIFCPLCSGIVRKYGKDKFGQQRYRCNPCAKTFIADKRPMRLQRAKAILCLKLLVEGNSIRSTGRISEVHRDTILHLIEVIGERCEKVMEEQIRDIPLQYVQADEIWGFVGEKEGHKRKEEKKNPQLEDAYTFVGIEAKTKLVLCYELGRRDIKTATRFMEKLKNASDGRFQLTTDGLRAYIEAVEETFGIEIDFAQLVKFYKSDESRQMEWHYSPGDFVSAVKTPIMGDPETDKISTSHVERQNLTIRMSLRRLTRLTNVRSKKWRNLEKALAIQFAFYNFCRVRQTLHVTPAMEARITDHVWTLEELIGDILR